MEENIIVKKKQNIGLLIGIYCILAIAFGIVSFMELNKVADGEIFSEIIENMDLMFITMVCIVVWIAAAFIYAGKRILNYLEDMDLEKKRRTNSKPTIYA